MNRTERRTTYYILYFVGLYFLKRKNPMLFGLSDSLVSIHTFCTEVFHAVQAARGGLGTILAVGALGWVLHGQHRQHVVHEEIERVSLDTFGGNWD